MAQLCNVAYAYQLETFSEPADLQAFVDDLPVAPDAPKQPVRRSRVSDDLLSMMAPGSARPAAARSG